MDKNFKILFGDKFTSPATIQKIKEQKANNQEIRFDLNFFPNASKYIFLHQTHSDNGAIVTSESNFSVEGDFLVTDQKNVALCVLTADCLPIVLYDTKNHVAGVAHSGWRGSVQQIAKKTIYSMIENFSSNPENIYVYLGPNACKCCYEVSADFKIDAIKQFGEATKNNLKSSIIKKNNKLYFDNIAFTIKELTDAGIQEKNINLENNKCTICNPNFGSFRRYGLSSPLQISAICLI